MSLVLSLFPGLGLLDMAFEELDFCVVRGPDVLWGGDVRQFSPPAGVFDGVIGGPPCQSFSSLANLVRAKGHEPRFGNLIPEFERVITEARPRWFLMENVPAAPVPAVEGYAIRDFVICNSWMDGGDGLGEEQERKRRFSFGVRGVERAPDLRRWIKPAALLLPAAESAVRAGLGLGPTSEWRTRTQAVTHSPEAVPVAIGGSGKVKRTRVGSVVAEPVDNSAAAKGRTRHPAVVAGNDDPPGQRRKTSEVLRERRTRHPAVVAGHDVPPSDPSRWGPSGRPPGRIGAVTGGGQEAECIGGKLKRGGRRSLAEMCRLQGLPGDFLADAPFTMDGKRKAVANGVPLPTGGARSPRRDGGRRMRLPIGWSIVRLYPFGFDAGVDHCLQRRGDRFVSVRIRYWLLGFWELRHVRETPANVDVIDRPPREVRLRAGGGR